MKGIFIFRIINAFKSDKRNKVVLRRRLIVRSVWYVKAGFIWIKMEIVLVPLYKIPWKLSVKILDNIWWSFFGLCYFNFNFTISENY